jgi:tetratricopeptide (TPR) repeat protein
MRIISRLLIVLGLAWVGVVLYLQAQEQQKLGEEADHTITILLFGGVILVGVIAGAVFALMVIPAIGDAVGSFFYSPNQQVEKDPHADALAKMAAGDYEGAAEEYVNVWKDNPSDIHAASEAARIYCERLGQHDRARDLLEEAVEQELPAEEGAFLGSRLVDIYWGYDHDAIRAREILIQIAESLPDTRHAANAQHRLLEIERALDTESAHDTPHLHHPHQPSEGESRPGGSA